MATRTTLRVLYQDTGSNRGGYNIGYCNPDATDAQLKELGQRLNALTTNTFMGVQRTDVTDITTAEFEYTLTAEEPRVTEEPIMPVFAGSGSYDATLAFNYELNAPAGYFEDIDVTRSQNTNDFAVSMSKTSSYVAGQYTLTAYLTRNGAQVSNRAETVIALS